MVLGEIKVNLVLASSTIAGIINQSSNQIRRNTTLFSLAQRRSINLYYPSYEVPSRLGELFSDRNKQLIGHYGDGKAEPKMLNMCISSPVQGLGICMRQIATASISAHGHIRQTTNIYPRSTLSRAG
jgi:hypothetical protein